MSETQHDASAPPDEPHEEPHEEAGPRAEPEEEPAAEPADEEGYLEEPLLPPGNPLRPLRGGIPLVLGGAFAFFFMAIRSQLRFGVPLATLGILVAAFGLLDLLGTFDDPDERVASQTTLRALAAPFALFAGGLGALWLFISLAVAGRLQIANQPVLTAGLLIPAAFLTTVVGLYRIGDTLGAWEPYPDSTPRPLHRRHGFWLVLACTVLYLPVLGSHSLSDPWETHYGEVAREILSRNDWISLWWAQDGWFWSKPILDFWLQALAMAAFGVRYQPGQMLSAVREGHIPWPEWAVRLPVFLLTLIAVYLLYKAVAKVFGRRAGLLGGLVLITMPQWFLVTHQTMTDMPFVAPMAAAMALLLLGAHSDPDEEVRVYEIDLGLTTIRVSAHHLVMGAIIACALPQILYLLSRNLELRPLGFVLHPDAFSSGSPGNCGLPGNEACRGASPVLRGFHPALQALVWLQALALLLYMNWGERRRQRLFFLAAWLFAALSTMAKGPAGFLLPALCALAYVVVSKRWKDLLRLEIPSGALILFAVALPWFVAMYARHGQPFTDRLLFHDMFKRAFTHVHDTNEGDDVSFRFYVWQLGYAMFPWTGLVPAGLLWWLRRREEGDRRSDASVFLVMWFVFAFSLFALMLTKFHHYILPAVPPAAMLTGILLDAMLRRAGAEPEERKAASSEAAEPAPALAPLDIGIYAAGMGVGTLLTVFGLARAITAARLLRTSGAQLAFLDSPMLGRLIAFTGGAILAGTVMLYGRRQSLLAGGAAAGGALDDDAPLAATPTDAALLDRFERVQLGAVGIAGALLVLVVGRDLAANLEGLPNQIRLLHLFTYNYRRPWPTSLDFTPTLWAFTVIASGLTFLLFAAKLRRHVTIALLALAMAFAAWGLDVYFVKTSPHWGQRETMLAYYKAAAEKPGPVIAYQMNWKGENFYSGNQIPVFVSSGKKFQDYIADEKRKGKRLFYFLTEHGRVSSLQNELGATKSFEKLTNPELNNKFLLVRAVFE